MSSAPMRAQLTENSKITIDKLKKANAMPEFRTQMRLATAPMVATVKAAIRSIPSKRSRYRTQGGSLRSAVANSITRKVNLSPRKVLIVIKAVPKGGKSNLGTVLEGSVDWNHPTFGHKPDVHQDPHPEFYPTLDKMALGAERYIYNVLDRFERKL